MHVQPATYTSGHHESVLRSHNWRTAANSAGYLLDSLSPDMKILDVGCGPGTITADLAALVPDGEVIGIDTSEDVLDQARNNADTRGLTNVRFEKGVVHTLKYPDDTFDVVHAHQVLQHCGEPVKALLEMKRVLKAKGVLATRESDLSVSSWCPEYPMLKKWLEIYMQVARGNGGDPTAGTKVHAWAHEAGFDRSCIDSSASTWCFTSQEDRTWWGHLWADRVLQSDFFHQAVNGGHATVNELQQVSKAWREWSEEPDGRFVVVHGQILCWNIRAISS